MSGTVYRHLEQSQQIALQRQYLQNIEAQLWQLDQNEDAARAMLDSGDDDATQAGEELMKQVETRRKQSVLARAAGEKKLDELNRLARLSERASNGVARPGKARKNGHAPASRNGHAPVTVDA